MMMTRLRQQGGFGLIELLIAMTVLNIAIFALIAAFSSGMLTLQRASRVTTAAMLADVEMERLRAIRHCDIRLVPEPGCEVPGLVDEPATPASADKPGADGRTYRVEVSIGLEQPAEGVGRDVKKVTIVVRDVNDGLKVLTQQSSTFDEATG